MPRVAATLVLMLLQAISPQERVEKQPAFGGWTYSFNAQFTLPASSTLNDYIVWAGSSSKTTYITKIEKTCTETTATVFTDLLVRRTSETGGTPTSITLSPMDPNAPTATSSLVEYGAGLTTGNSGGSVYLERWRTIWGGSATTQSGTIRYTWGRVDDPGLDFKATQIAYTSQQIGTGDQPTQPLTLRGTTDLIAMFSGGSTGSTITCTLSGEVIEQ